MVLVDEETYKSNIVRQIFGDYCNNDRAILDRYLTARAAAGDGARTIAPTRARQRRRGHQRTGAGQQTDQKLRAAFLAK